MTLQELSHSLGVPEETLLHEALQTWLFHKLSDIDHHIAEITIKYGVQSPDEIATLIRNGAIDGHPAWEDAIRLEGLFEYREKLWQQVIRSGGVSVDHK